MSIRDPKDAVAHKIGMVHQHFMLIPVFTVAENIMLGSEPVKPWPFNDHQSATERIVALAKEYNFVLDPSATIENLPIGTQQRVEILKALSHDAEVLILDEPTAVLTPQEAEALIIVMRTLKAQGKSIIFITHKLKEVLEIADGHHRDATGRGRGHDDSRRNERRGPRHDDGGTQRQPRRAKNRRPSPAMWRWRSRTSSCRTTAD